VSDGARPFAFLVALAAVFGLALLAGRGFAGDEQQAGGAAPPKAMAGMDPHGAGGDPARSGSGRAPAAAAHGLGVAENGLRLVAPGTARAGSTARPYAFRIVDDHGATVRDFAIEHTKRLHFIVVRRDLTGFQHLHPRQAADGSWRLGLRLPGAGAYRVFADVRRPGGAATTLAGDVLVPGAFAPRALPAASTTTSTDGYDVTLHAGAGTAGREGRLAFSVRRDGRPVAVQPYLGADGHLVALREGDLAYLHVHPLTGGAPGAIAFAATYPSAGRYRLFLQFRHAGRVHTAAVTQEVGAA
jgi:hypothetical protein